MGRRRGGIAAVTVTVTAIAVAGVVPVSGKVPSGTHSLERADVKFTGDRPGARAGSGVVGVDTGDLNGDGFQDVVIGAPFDDTNGRAAGAAYVVYGPVASNVDLSEEAKLLGEVGDFAGESIVASHDLDEDGFDDLVLGAPGGDRATQGETPAPGRVYMLYGRPERLTGTDDLSEVADAVLVGEHPADTLGHSVDALDFDGDGVSDLAIGASGFGGLFPAGLGKVHVLYGAGERLSERLAVGQAADAAFLGEHHASITGIRVGGVGDLDGDGVEELAVGAQAWGGTTGAAYLLYGDERRSGTASLATAADARLAGEIPGDIAGTALRGGGDLDGDGFDDIAVGAPNLRGEPGSTYVFYDGDARITGQVSLVDADATIVGDAGGDNLGRGVAIADDLDGDGFAELVIGAPRNDAAGEDAGAVYVVPGGERLSGSATASDVAVLMLTGEAAGDLAGGESEGVHGKGDINADGRTDLLVAASGHDAGGENAGAVYGLIRSVRPSPRSAQAGFHYEATGCVEPVAGFNVDPDIADRFVPEPFEVRVDELGNAFLAVPAIKCDQIAIDGQDVGGALLSDVGIRIESPDGSPGSHFYQLWQPTTNEKLHARMRSLGMDTPLVPDATFDLDESLPGVATATAHIPWERVPYLVQAQTPPPLPIPPGGNTWWHRGPRGIIKVAYTFHDRELAFGTASVRTDEGSALAELLGARERTADEGALVRIHHYEGTIELVNNTAAGDN